MNVDHIKREKLSQIQLRRKLDEQSVLVEEYTIAGGDVSERHFAILHTHKDSEKPLLIKIDYLINEESGEKIKLSTPRECKKNGKRWGFYPKKRGRIIISKERIGAYKRLFRKSFHTTFRTVDEMLSKASNGFVQDIDITSRYTKYQTFNPNIKERYIITISE